MKNEGAEKSSVDKSFLSLILTLCLAILAGGVAWGVNSTKIDQNKSRSLTIKENLTFRIRRMETRTDKQFDKVDRRFDKLDKKLQTILRAVRRK